MCVSCLVTGTLKPGKLSLILAYLDWIPNELDKNKSSKYLCTEDTVLQQLSIKHQGCILKLFCWRFAASRRMN